MPQFHYGVRHLGVEGIMAKAPYHYTNWGNHSYQSLYDIAK